MPKEKNSNQLISTVLSLLYYKILLSETEAVVSKLSVGLQVQYCGDRNSYAAHENLLHVQDVEKWNLPFLWQFDLSSLYFVLYIFVSLTFGHDFFWF